MIYAFDVDGTLTPSRERMDEEFRQFFIKFSQTYPCYLVTGSDYTKTLEQVGEEVCMTVAGVFNCMGNLYTVKGKEVYRNDFELTDEEEQALINELVNSQFQPKVGNHIEKRIGSVNFSIVGRNADAAMRKRYVKWDIGTKERIRIRNTLLKNFDRLDVQIGGETGLDIFIRGRDKSQIIEYTGRPLTFFGDACEPGGNDYWLAIASDHVYRVNDWTQTFKILTDIEGDIYDRS